MKPPKKSMVLDAINDTDLAEQDVRLLRDAPVLSKIPLFLPKITAGNFQIRSHITFEQDPGRPIGSPEIARRGFFVSDDNAHGESGSAGTFVETANNAKDVSSPMPLVNAPPTPDVQEQLVELARPEEESQRSLLYSRPSYSGEDRLFFDLVAYAPGLNTSAADIRAVIDAEAAPQKSNKPGVIEDNARRLFDKARPAEWRMYVRKENGSGPTHILYDGQGRYAWERTLPIRMREQVVCDGTTLWHLYPELGLAARRSVSRFHRLGFARLVPWVLPRPEDLARGADLRVVAERTVAIVPHGIAETKDGKPLPHAEVRLVFAEDGQLSERQLVEMPAGKVRLRETYSDKGTIEQFDGEGKQLAEHRGELRLSRDAVNLKPDTSKLVVLALPYRTRDHVLKTRKIENKDYGQLRFEDGLALLAADFAAGNNEVVNVFQRCFAGRDQHPIGLYALLASCGQNLDSEHLDVLAQHPHEPLAQYLALHSSPVLRKHASQWAVGSNPWGEGFLQRLAMAHALLQRWQNGRAIGGTETQRTGRTRPRPRLRAGKQGKQLRLGTPRFDAGPCPREREQQEGHAGRVSRSRRSMAAVHGRSGAGLRRSL